MEEFLEVLQLRFESGIKRLLLVVLVLGLAAVGVSAQSPKILKNGLKKLVAGKRAVVGVSIISDDGKLRVSYNGKRRFPFQSVFKLHIALKMLSEIDKGNFKLDQIVEIKKDEMMPGLYSPIRDKHPDGASLPLSEILEYTVSLSDNVGCDVLLRMLGGPSEIDGYLRKNGFKGFEIKLNEETQQAEWDLQFQNWTTPNTSSEILKAFYDNGKAQLSKESYAFLWKVLRETSTGAGRLKGKLPKDTVVAHKTGTSGKHKTTGEVAAVNDIGVIFLPDGRHVFVSVYVTESMLDYDGSEAIIADIGKLVWDFYTGGKD
ncbi:MAG: class A beta-lactamase, subclass A2 [Pyrinomonadaceae bacterium]